MPAPRGKFIWYDVMTHDTKAAAAFYSDVIGWNAQEWRPSNRPRAFRRWCRDAQRPLSCG